MIESGIRPIDERIGGVLAGRPHIVTGGPGSGKTALALQFAHAGLQRREGVLVLTDARPDDLRSLARHIGLDLDAYIRAGRLLLLRYRDGFTSRFAFAATPDLAADHLQRFAEQVNPARVVVDSFAPFLADGTATGAGVSTLVRFLRGSRATSLVTYASDLEAGYDVRLAPMIQEAAAIFRVAREANGTHALEAVSSRFALKSTRARFAIHEGVGIVPTELDLQLPPLPAEPVVDETTLLLSKTLPTSAIAS